MGNPAAALAELRRVLRAGGRLALTCWSYPPPPALGVAAEAIEAAGVPWPDDVPLPPFRAYSSPEAFAALLAAAGFNAGGRTGENLAHGPLPAAFDSASDRHGRGVLNRHDDIVGRQPEALL